MPPRFDRAARHLSFLAHEHALAGGQNCVDIGHLLLALAEEPGVQTLLGAAAVDRELLRATVVSRQTVDTVSHARDGVLPRSNVLDLAWCKAHDSADETGALHITPVHLLSGTVRALAEIDDGLVLRALGRLTDGA